MLYVMHNDFIELKFNLSFQIYETFDDSTKCSNSFYIENTASRIGILSGF